MTSINNCTQKANIFNQNIEIQDQKHGILHPLNDFTNQVIIDITKTHPFQVQAIIFQSMISVIQGNMSCQKTREMAAAN